MQEVIRIQLVNKPEIRQLKKRLKETKRRVNNESKSLLLQRIAELEDASVLHSQQLGSQATRQTQLELQISDLLQRVTLLETGNCQLQEQLGVNLERMKKVEDKQTQQTQELGELSNRVATLEKKRLKLLEDEQKAQHTKLAAIETVLRPAQARQTEQLNSLSEKVRNLEGTQSQQGQGLQSVSQRVTTVERDHSQQLEELRLVAQFFQRETNLSPPQRRLVDLIIQQQVVLQRVQSTTKAGVEPALHSSDYVLDLVRFQIPLTATALLLKCSNWGSITTVKQKGATKKDVARVDLGKEVLVPWESSGFQQLILDLTQSSSVFPPTLTLLGWLEFKL
jgi:DNA polymerase III alpha subunit (gram-positive type)